MFSVVIPVYQNSDSLPLLVNGLGEVLHKMPVPAEVVFVIDGSPDDSAQKLMDLLPKAPFPSQVLLLSRNFGSLSAVRAGIEAARGEACAVIAADLQEPLDILLRYQELLAKGNADVVFGRRLRRADPALGVFFSRVYWGLYRRFVLRDIPSGGVDTFAINRRVRDALVAMAEANTSLVGMLVWAGYRRSFLDYERQRRVYGRSAWTFPRKLHYLMDSVFGFTDLPVKILLGAGSLGILVSMALGMVITFEKVMGGIEVPGYAATLTTILFFGALNLFGLGIIGGYVWRTFENTKRRPNYLVSTRSEFGGSAKER